MYKCTLRGNTFHFHSIREVLAKASEEKSGDIMAEIAAVSNLERMAAKVVLSDLTLEEIYDNPVIPYEEDEVTRVIYDDINLPIYNEIKSWTVGDLRNYILSHDTEGDHLQRISKGLTSEMISGVAKLMSSMDLVLGSQKIRPTAHCNTTIGEQGRLAFRAQPNHPTDDLEGILNSTKEGLSYGSGDALIGVNPNNDSVESVKNIFQLTHDFIRKWEIPTQNSVLAHITTQMEALKQGAPVDLLFQSIAGTQSANDDFGLSKELIDEAEDLMKKYGTSTGPNQLYFETGQGAEVSLDKHKGVDMQTLESRSYGFGRHWKPFMVNNVTGFIGPETIYNGTQLIRGDLEDLFMGKLHGIAMGMAPAYTSHTEADQNEKEISDMLITLAGANYFIGLPRGDDVMLSYQDTSYHDNATLREMFGLRPLTQFEKWLEKHEIIKDGKLWTRAGDLSIFD